MTEMGEAPGPQRRGPWPGLETIARSAPFAILTYVLILAAFRLSISESLSLEETSLVGRIDWRVDYGSGHGPFVHWLTRFALELTDWNWPLALTVVGYGALAGFHLAVWTLTRRLAGVRAGLLAVAASAFLPPVVWTAATSLAQPALLLCMAALLLASAHRALAADGRAAWFAFALLGGVTGLGVLCTYFMGFLALPLLAAMLVDRELRTRLLRPAALLGLGVFGLIGGPSVLAAALDLEASDQRLARFYRPDTQMGGLDLTALDAPGVGLDGAASLALALAFWGAAVLLVWLVAARVDRRADPVPGRRTSALSVAYVRALGRAAAGGVVLLLLVLLIGDMRHVEPRLLTPILAALPIWLAATWPLRRSAGPVIALAGALYLAVLPGFWAQVAYSNHRYNIPFDQLGGFIAQAVDAPVPIRSLRRDDAANALLALRWPGASSPDVIQLDGRVILLWRGRGDAPGGLWPPGFGPAAGVVTVALRYRNGMDEDLVFSFQVFERL